MILTEAGIADARQVAGFGEVLSEFPLMVLLLMVTLPKLLRIPAPSVEV